MLDECWWVKWCVVVLLLPNDEIDANDYAGECVDDPPTTPPIQSEYLDPALALNPHDENNH